MFVSVQNQDVDLRQFLSQPSLCFSVDHHSTYAISHTLYVNIECYTVFGPPGP